MDVGPLAFRRLSPAIVNRSVSHLRFWFSYARHDMSLAVFGAIPAVFAVVCGMQYFADAPKKHRKD